MKRYSTLWNKFWDIFPGEEAPRWSYFTQINGRRISKQTKQTADELAVGTLNRSTHHSQQHLSSPSYRKYNTIFYKRTKRTEHLLSYKEQRTGQVCTATVVPPAQGFVNIWNKWLTSLKPNTLAVGQNVPNVSWIQNGPTCASYDEGHVNKVKLPDTAGRKNFITIY